MKRHEFAELTAEDARTEAATEPDDRRRAAWLELAAAIDTSRGTTAGELKEEFVDRLYDSTGAAQAQITIESLARSIGEDRDSPSNDHADSDGESEAGNPAAPA